MLYAVLGYAFAADACSCTGLYFWSSSSGECSLLGDTNTEESDCCTRGGCPVDKGAEDSCRLCGAMHDLSSCTSCSTSSLCLPGYGGPNCDTWVGRTDAPDTPSPPTPAPDTPAPDTPAPKTPAPDTTAPDTLAPDTPAPPTPAPDTPFPDTPAPKTPAPDTPFPDTPAPETPAPDTLAPDTPAPPTPAPDTPFPDTPAPSTPAPKTPSPDTNPPDTPVPDTPFPDTSAPLTPSPDTSSPDTPAPGTPFPDTASPTKTPTTTIVPDVLSRATPSPATIAPSLPTPSESSALLGSDIEMLGTMGAVTSVIGGGGAAASAGMLVLLSGGCNLNGRKDLPWLLHPTQMELFGSEDAGVVVGNTAIMVGFAFVCYLVLRTVHALGQRRGGKLGLFAALDTQGLLRLPSSPLLVFQVFFLGTCYGSLGLLLEPPSIPGFFLGLVSGAGCVGVPVTMFFVARRGVPADALYVACHSRCVVERIFLGEGEWVSRHPERHWVQRYSSVMRTYRQEVAWFWLFEAMAALALSGIYAIHPENYTGCGHVCVFSALIFMIMTSLEGTIWPHARPRDSMYGFVSNGLQGAAMVLAGIGYYKGDVEHWVFSTAGHLLFAGMVVVLVKGVCDVLSEVYLFVKGQRVWVQECYWKGSAVQDLMASSDDMSLYEPKLLATGISYDTLDALDTTGLRL